MLTSKRVYYWNGSLNELKAYTEDNLCWKGVWKSPGGDVKQFVNTKYSFKWHGPKNKMLTIVQDDEENALSDAFKRLAITEEGNFGNCGIESDREAVNKTQESCQGCSKSDTAIAELQLDVAMLSALLHKNQETISSQSTQMQEFDVLIQKLMCDNKEKSSELQVIKAKVRELINARGNYIQINKVDAQTKVSEFIQRSELSVPEVKHMGNRTKIAESIQFNNNSPSRVKESAADVCILDCNGNDKSISDISVIMHEDRRTIETNQPHKNEDKRSKLHNTNLCRDAAPNRSSNVRNNDKQHGDLHTSNTSLNNNPNIEALGPQQKIPVRITNRGHVTSNRTEQSRKKRVRSYVHNNQRSNGGPLGSHYGSLSSTDLHESNADFFRTVPVRKQKDPCLPRKISRDKILFYRFHY